MSIGRHKRVISPRPAAQETLINDLNSRLARVEPMALSGKSTILEFFSREAVEMEKEALTKENAKLTASVKEKDTYISQKNDRIADLERRRKRTDVVVVNILTLSYHSSERSTRRSEGGNRAIEDAQF
jgi:hypothetical protein